VTLVQPRRNTAALAAISNPVLAMGELGYETDTKKSKRGDGVTTWNALPYLIDTASASSTYRTAFKIEKYGTVDTTGATDSGAAVRATIAAAYAAGGGTIEFPKGIIRIDSLPTLPNDGAAIPNQPPLAFVGQGCHRDGSLTATLTSLPGGTILDIRDSTGIAKIDTRGKGVLVLRDLTLTNMGTADTIPFVKHTNTTLHVDNIAIWGHSTKLGTACDQDGIQSGSAAASYAPDGSATSCFNAYGTTINAVYFDHIRRGIHGMTSCNAMQIGGLTFGQHCGGDATAGAIHFDGTGDQSRANQVSDVVLESMGYVYPIHMTNAAENTFRGLQIWDATTTMLTAIFEEGVSGGNFYDGYLPVPPKLITTTGTSWGARGKQFFLGVLGNAINLVQPWGATGSESTKLLRVARSLFEATSPNGDVFSVAQNGVVSVGSGSFGTTAALTIANTTGSITYSDSSLIKGTGSIDLYAGTTVGNRVRVMRGVFQLNTSTTAARIAATWGAGMVYYDTTLGKPVFSDGTVWRDAAGTAV